MSELQQTVLAMTKDPEFLKASESQLEGYSFTVGQKLRDGVSAVGRTDPATIKFLQDFLSAEFNMKFN
jgi:hypothetical protein